MEGGAQGVTRATMKRQSYFARLHLKHSVRDAKFTVAHALHFQSPAFIADADADDFCSWHFIQCVRLAKLCAPHLHAQSPTLATPAPAAAGPG
jgi:hypothetical protein